MKKYKKYLKTGITDGLSAEEIKALKKLGDVSGIKDVDLDEILKKLMKDMKNGGSKGISGNTISSDKVKFNKSSVDKAFSKHGKDFGSYPDGSKDSVQAFNKDIKTLIDTGKQVKGTYRSEPGTHIYNPSTRQWVFINADGTFNTAFILSQQQYKYLIEIGVVK